MGRQILNHDPYVKYVKDKHNYNTEILDSRFTVNDILHRYMYVAWSVDQQNNWIWGFTEEDFRTKYQNDFPTDMAIKALHASILAFLDDNNLYVA